jgi:hypothetical protein
MATTTKALFRGAATTSVGTTLYTVPAATITIVSNIVVVNTASAAATFDIALDGVKLAETQAIAANSSAYFDIKQVLDATDVIAGGASATSVNFHISGVEIS